MPKNIIRILISLLLVCSASLLFFKNQNYILDIQKKAFFNVQEQDFFVIKGFEQYVADPLPVQLYRGNSQRTGEFDFHLQKKDFKIDWSSKKILQNIHTASKPTPIVDASGIYVGSDTGIFYKFSPQGEVLWSFHTESDNKGIHGSALVDQHQVYFGNYGGQFYCLNKFNGNLVWSTQVANAVGSSPLLIEGKIIFSAEFMTKKEGYLVALNAATGEKIWTSEFFGEQVHSSPTFDPKNLILAVGDNNGVLRGVDLYTGETLWKLSTGGPIKGTAVYADEHFCFGSWDKIFYCVKSLTGELMFSIPTDGKIQSSAAFDEKNKNLFFSNSEGVLYKIDLKKQSVAQKTSLITSEPNRRLGMPSPIILKDQSKVFILSSCELKSLCLFNENLKLIKSYSQNGFISGSITPWMDSLYFLTEGQSLNKIN